MIKKHPLLIYPILFIFSATFSIMIFINLFASIDNIKKSYEQSINTPENNHKSQALSGDDDILSQLDDISKCRIANPNDFHIDFTKQYKNISCTIKKIEGKVSSKTNKKNTTNYLITSIYILLIITLNTQVTLFLYTFFLKNKASYYYYHLSDWAINTPPILGVLGTIISFALLMEQAKSSDIQKVFADGFFDAAITTVIGGIFYTINLALKIRIYPRTK